MKICMIAAENGAIAGAKVGGLGDVLRDIPRALTALGHEVHIIMPAYGRFAAAAGAEPQPLLQARFRGAGQELAVSRLDSEAGGPICWLLDHPLFAGGGPGQIYCDDPPARPFATDASKFALFCTAACELLRQGRFGEPEVIHLHDWHAALVAVLARFDPKYRPLGDARLVFTIHNLAMQGIRPFADDESSLEAWFPELRFDGKAIADPRYPDCVNPLRAAINLCDRVHTVSPAYASEIRKPSRPELGFHGGEGLESDLRRAHRQHRLVGILNGCGYDGKAACAPTPEQFVADASAQVMGWVGGDARVKSSHFIALARLAAWRESPPRHWLTSISRLTPQKIALFQTKMETGASCLENLLAELPPDHACVMLGSGDADIESFLARIAAGNGNFLFLNGYSEPLSEAIYALGDLFLMPSSFEPCGIGQMLAMRAGQPCLAHRVGGLKDTVANNTDGFTFSGRDPARQSAAFIRKLKQALRIKRNSPHQWQAISKAAAARRFNWQDSARKYCEKLYNDRSAG